jgi:hypothetical protein
VVRLGHVCDELELAQDCALATRRGAFEEVHLTLSQFEATQRGADEQQAKPEVLPGTTEQQIPLSAFSVAIVLGVLGIAFYASQFSAREALSVASIAGLVAGASLASGGVIGFLFGIPRTLQDERPTQGGGTVYRANTNLEQISDWLTKILVGVGLTQIGRLPDQTSALTERLAPGLGGLASADSFALALLVYFTLCGFLLGYLWTRLFLGGLLWSADKRIADLDEKVTVAVSTSQFAAAASVEIRNQVELQASSDVKALNMVDAALNPGRGAPQPTPDEFRDVLRSASPTVRTQVFLKAQEMRSRTWRDKQEEMERVIPVLKALAETGDEASHSVHGQLGFALKDQTTPDLPAAEQELSTAIDLRGPWQDHGWLFYEFNRAACRVLLDAAFARGEPSPDDVRARITEDLHAAASERFLVDLINRGEAHLKEWMQLNQVTMASLRRPLVDGD